MLFMPGFSLLWGRILDIDQSDSLIYLNKSSHFLIDFAFGLPSSYADHYLIIYADTPFGLQRCMKLVACDEILLMPVLLLK